MSEVEVFQLDLDEELLSHLSIPESIAYLWDERIDSDLIVDEEIREIFEWQLGHLRDHKKPATATVLADEFDLELTEPLTAVGDLVTRLRERWMRNHVREYMEKISVAYREDPAKVVDVMPRIAHDLVAKVGRRGEAFGTGDFERSIHNYDEMVLRGPGGSFGFPEVDHHFHGMRGVTFFLAPPKTYKSWIGGANVIVENVLQGRHGWLASLELPAVETDMRIRCLTAGVPYWKYVRGALSIDDRKHLKDASEILDGSGIYRCVKPEIGHRSIEEMVERAGDAGADFLIVDQLQYVETREGKQLGACDPKEYWQPLNIARDLSDDMPIVFIHQFNRTVMYADKMPEMQQAKGSAAVEETATLALGMWANKDMRRSNIVELGTLASRNYQYQSWEIGINLSQSCDFDLLGIADHSDD